MHCIKQLPFQYSALTIAIIAVLTTPTSWSLELVQEPPLPTSKSAFVAPNVIISIDDSGSMEYGIKTSRDGSSSTGAGYTYPDSNGKWKDNAKRINVLKYSLKTVFEDKTLIPDNKIRIAWQTMHNNAKSSDAGNVNSSSMNTNSMRPIDAIVSNKSHRANFLSFVAGIKADNGTPSHKMFSQADAYMRRTLSKNSPWSTDPGGTGSKSTEYLGCRRNYHIMMTDGRWNGDTSGGNQDGTNWSALNGRQAYNTNSDQTRIYQDDTSDTLSDWAFKSWMDPLQDPTKLKDSENLKPSKIYDDASAIESFTKTKTVDVFETRPIYGPICIDNRWWGCNQWGTGQIGTEQVKIGTRQETKSVDLQKYWNPKYNPATWPHMVTYTIGFSDEAVTWPGASEIIAPSTKVPFGYDNSFVDLITGWQTWPNMGNENRRSLDLWHSAINGRGRFYAITEAEDLAKAFTEIIGKINEESAPLPDEIAGGGSTSGYNVSQNNAGIFASVYSPKDGWSGYITASRAIEPEEYACPTKTEPEKTCIRFPDVISGWESKTTAMRLDELTSLDNRLILTWSDSTNAGTAFKWPSMETPIGYSTAQIKNLLGVTTSGDLTAAQKIQAQNIINYIRGDKSLEGTTAERPMRIRHSRQGDVVNSEIWYTGGPIGNYSLGYSSFVKAQKDRTPILYVGGNDGMLHGFSAKDGKELLAYVPRGVVPGLKSLSDKDYQHRYYVDGSPMTGDIRDNETWKTLLVGTLGAGGKGYFLLNVTNPSTFSSTPASDLVVLDRTRASSEAAQNCSALSGSAQTACNATVAEDGDIGHITAQPGRNPANLQEATQITRMNNGRWAVVMGNGYNSTNQRPVLLVQYLDGNKALKRIQATTDATGSGNALDNGLSSPALADLDGDGTTDIVYAGDNLGNLWKFDLTSANDSNWQVAFGNNRPLFTARGPVALNGTRNQVQPITAPPTVRANDRSMVVGEGKNAKTVPVGGMMVAFGTGRNVTSNDRRTDITQNVQTLYSVLDSTRYRMNADKTSLEVHPGSNDCSTNTSCVPTPAPVGTMGATGVTLAKQSITTVDGDFATVTATQELKAETWKNYKGWYLDFPVTGERLLKPMQFFDGSNILAVYSETPSGIKNSESDNINESCVPVKVDTSAGSQFRTLINIMDGKRATIQLVDYNGDGLYNADDLNVDRAAVKTGTPILITKRDRIVDLTGGGGGRDTLARMPESSMRPSWRQLK
ncbi:type IV fimbrial biogenesis protein pily1 [Comamonas aquatica DA1877]|jgi:type IV pilus assembly protein PilY1|uniref:Type IV fimbrial biogenesis protein pily1 n=1 Tax=Comamonas aquatica DA1877 TaxID=1457173 RepID=A0A014P596_9BURK|nr:MULTISPECIES: PilC/PilY family type IV pilus protein [Comamonas]EXU81315.1 type IV fimbrial biogenesis protein pily1 [Comamonas aquatica DA1877]MRT20345.1 pilus assembly protein PilC [Comamonas sp. CAH-2]